MAISSEDRSKIWILILAPFFSMMLPYLVIWFDKNSKCNIIPLVDVSDDITLFLELLYFGIPFIAGLYGFYFISVNSANEIHVTENTILKEKKPKLFYGIMILNLFSPLLLILWMILFWFSNKCYPLNLNVIF
jgi:hypothetical protein